MQKDIYSNREKWGKETRALKWFGFRLHLIADAAYEIPVAFEITKASNSEKTETEKLLKGMKKAGK